MPDCRFCKKYWSCRMAHETSSLYYREPCEEYEHPEHLKFKLKIPKKSVDENGDTDGWVGYHKWS